MHVAEGLPRLCLLPPLSVTPVAKVHFAFASKNGRLCAHRFCSLSITAVVVIFEVLLSTNECVVVVGEKSVQVSGE